MSRSRLGAALLALGIALGAAVALGGRPTATATGGCEALAQGVLRVTASERTTAERVRYGDSGAIGAGPSRSLRGPVDLGTTSLRVTTCRADGGWVVSDVAVEQPRADLRLVLADDTDRPRITSVQPVSGPLGYAIVHRRTSGRAVLLDVLRCSATPRTLSTALRRSVTGLRAVPRPDAHDASLGVVAPQVALPAAGEDRFWCGRLGSTVSLPLDVDADGRPSLRWGDLVREEAVRTASTSTRRSCAGSVYCADVREETVTLRAQ